MEQQATGKRAAIYTRVSSEGQAHRGKREYRWTNRSTDIEEYACESKGTDHRGHWYRDIESGDIKSPAKDSSQPAG